MQLLYIRYNSMSSRLLTFLDREIPHQRKPSAIAIADAIESAAKVYPASWRIVFHARRAYRRMHMAADGNIGDDSIGKHTIDVLFVQSVFCLFFSLILDGGLLLQMFIMTMAAHWTAVVTLAVRSRGRHRKWDHFFVRYGWLPIAAIGMPTIWIVWDAWYGL